MKQIVIIHGGDSYDSYEEYIGRLKDVELDYERLKPSKRWKDAIVERFRDTDILTPTMPNSANAHIASGKSGSKRLSHFSVMTSA